GHPRPRRGEGTVHGECFYPLAQLTAGGLALHPIQSKFKSGGRHFDGGRSEVTDAVRHWLAGQLVQLRLQRIHSPRFELRDPLTTPLDRGKAFTVEPGGQFLDQGADGDVTAAREKVPAHSDDLIIGAPEFSV